MKIAIRDLILGESQRMKGKFEVLVLGPFKAQPSEVNFLLLFILMNL